MLLSVPIRGSATAGNTTHNNSNIARLATRLFKSLVIDSSCLILDIGRAYPVLWMYSYLALRDPYLNCMHRLIVESKKQHRPGEA